MAEVIHAHHEYGSFFHMISQPNDEHNPNPWDTNGVFYGSGRDAMRSLLELGKKTQGWKRLLVPSYFCQSVVRSMASTGIEVVLYYDAPGCIPKVDFDPQPGDAILRMNYFGLRSSFPTSWAEDAGVEVIDDHTHDPWSDWAWSDDSDWCVASFRKVLPLPDGGVIWSPKRHEMPDQPLVTEERRIASLEKLAAMALRGLYLDGNPIRKDVFRQLSSSAEGRIGTGDISGMPEWTYDLLSQFPTQSWRKQRYSNYQVLTAALEETQGLQVLLPDDDAETCPFAGTLVFDSPELRDYVQGSLASIGVYLPILWELDNPAVDGIPIEHYDLSKRIVCVPCDMRYDIKDIERVAGLIRNICAEGV